MPLSSSALNKKAFAAASGPHKFPSLGGDQVTEGLGGLPALTLNLKLLRRAAQAEGPPRRVFQSMGSESQLLGWGWAQHWDSEIGFPNGCDDSTEMDKNLFFLVFNLNFYKNHLRRLCEAFLH